MENAFHYHTLEAEHETIGLNVFPLDLSCFVLILFCPPICPFWNWSVFPVSLLFRIINLFLIFIEVYS